MHQPGVEPAIFRSQVRRPNHCTTEPQIKYCMRVSVCVESLRATVRVRVLVPLMILRMRQSRKMMSRAIASSLWGPVMPWMKTRSRLNDVSTITASNSCRNRAHRTQWRVRTRSQSSVQQQIHLTTIVSKNQRLQWGVLGLAIGFHF